MPVMTIRDFSQVPRIMHSLGGKAHPCRLWLKIVCMHTFRSSVNQHCVPKGSTTQPWTPLDLGFLNNSKLCSSYTKPPHNDWVFGYCIIGWVIGNQFSTSSIFSNHRARQSKVMFLGWQWQWLRPHKMLRFLLRIGRKIFIALTISCTYSHDVLYNAHIKIS